jgi:putative Holliday junction resolvase
VDYGEKRTGTAVSDPTATIAGAADIYEGLNEEELIVQLSHMADRYGACGIVVGLPLNMNGTVGERARRVGAFIEALQKRSGIPVYSWDERLTTKQSMQMVHAHGKKVTRRLKLDRISAVLILQSFLDRMKFDTLPGNSASSRNRKRDT